MSGTLQASIYAPSRTFDPSCLLPRCGDCTASRCSVCRQCLETNDWNCLEQKKFAVVTADCAPVCASDQKTMWPMEKNKKCSCWCSSQAYEALTISSTCRGRASPMCTSLTYPEAHRRHVRGNAALQDNAVCKPVFRHGWLYLWPIHPMTGSMRHWGGLQAPCVWSTF